jgi:fructose-specific component phosphotransferase system IIB-like protein
MASDNERHRHSVTGSSIEHSNKFCCHNVTVVILNNAGTKIQLSCNNAVRKMQPYQANQQTPPSSRVDLLLDQADSAHATRAEAIAAA